MKNATKQSKRLLALLLAAALVLPHLLAPEKAAADPKTQTLSVPLNISMEHTDEKGKEWKVTCKPDSAYTMPSGAKLTYRWTYLNAAGQTVKTTTAENFLELSEGEVNGKSWVKCQIQADYAAAISLVNDTYRCFLHRNYDAQGYDSWFNQMLDHSISNHAVRVNNILNADISVLEAMGLVYAMVFSYEYLSCWKPDPNGGYVRGNPVPLKDEQGVHLPNTPRQLIYDCFLFLLGVQPTEQEVENYLKIYKEHMNQGASYTLTSPTGDVTKTFPINAGMVYIIHEMAFGEGRCGKHLEERYKYKCQWPYQFSYTEDDITKEETHMSGFSSELRFPSKFIVRDYVQTEDCTAYECRAEKTFWASTESYASPGDYASEYDGCYFDYAEDRFGEKTTAVKIEADGNAVINLYYTRNIQIRDYTVLYYQKNLKGVYTFVEEEKRRAEEGSVIRYSDLKKTYAGFSCQGGKRYGSKPGKTLSVSGGMNTSAVMPESGNVFIALFYDRNSYKVSLTAKDGIRSVSGEGSYLYGETVKVDVQPEAGYSFDRWADSSKTVDGSTLVFREKELSFSMPANNVKLNAYGKLNPKRTLTVDPNGGDWKGSSDKVTEEIREGVSEEIADPKRTGYLFDGWQVTGKGSSLSGDTFTMGSENAVLTAKWKPSPDTEYRVEHYKEGLDGKYVLEETEIKHGTTGSIVKPEVKKYEGFTSPWPGSLIISAEGDSVMKYQYTRNRYHIVFHGNGAEQGNMEEMELKYGEKKELPENGFLHFGYEFDGWNTSADGNGTFYADKAQVESLSSENGGEIHLYAVWYELPFITAPDRYFSIDEAKSGQITEAELMKKAGISGPADGMYVVDYDAEFWKAQTEPGEILVTYAATDSKGRTITAKATAHIVDTDPVYDLHTPYVRFISPKYWRYESGPRAGELVDPEDGGVEWWSVWRNDPAHRDVMDFAMALEETIVYATDTVKIFGKEYTFQTAEMIYCAQVQFCYYFTYEDVQKVKKYVEDHGMGNIREPDALHNFTIQFAYCRKREEEHMYDPEVDGPLKYLERIKN